MLTKQKQVTLLIEFFPVVMPTGNHSVEFHVLTRAIQNACLLKAQCMVTVTDADILLGLLFRV